MKPLLKLLMMFILIAMLVLLPTGCARPQEIEIRSPGAPATTGKIYIGGGVVNPGYYLMKDGDTISSLVQSAGRTASGASPTEIKLIVSQTVKEPQKIDINRADLWLLQVLPGIGETLAKRIIEYRNRNGYFRSVNELPRVEGIGAATFEKIKDLVTVSD